MHDSRGASLKVGDRVLIEAEVTQLCEGDDTDYCNVTIQVVTPKQTKPPEMTPPTLSAINTRMLTKVAAAIAVLFAFFAFAGDAQAGPLRNRIQARRAANCRAGGGGVAVAPASSVMPLTAGSSGCPGGQCPAPGRTGFFNRLRR